MKLELSNMKKILSLGLLISSIIYFSSCKKNGCDQVESITRHYDSISQTNIDAFILDTTKKITFRKYKSDSVIVFTFKNKLVENFLNQNNSSLVSQCSTFRYYSYIITHHFSYYNQFNEPLTISQNNYGYFIKFRNIICYFNNNDLKTKNYKFDTISFSNNNFYNVFQSNETYQTPNDYTAYYNTKYGFLRLRLSFYDIWDIKL